MEQILETVRSPGYKLLEEEWTAKYGAMLSNAPDLCDTNEKWQLTRGRLLQIRETLNTEAGVVDALKKLEGGVESDEDSRNPLEM